MTNFDEQQDFKTKQQIVSDDDVTLPRTSLPASAAAQQSNVHEIGSIIEGRYKILASIGEGGVGRVYKAQQLATGRLVAVKMLHPNVLEESARLRFHQEAKIASAINHPNAVAIYDFGENDSGDLYLAMEYVEGESLSARIKRVGQLSPVEVADIFTQLTDALTDAHEKNILHRDLKPSNVMLAQTKKRKDIVKILDFGIAKRANQGEQSLTKTGEVFGTPLYMSPEQCNGEPLTAAADIYSVGCMLYEALLGEPPHVGPNFISTMTMHCQEPTKKFAKARPDLKIPARLEEITLKCLNKNPGDRFASIDELHKQLQDCITPNKQGAASRPGNNFLVLLTLLLLALAGYFSYLSFNVHKPPEKPNPISTNLELSQYRKAFAQAKKETDQEAIVAIGMQFPRILLRLNTKESRLEAADFLTYLEKAQEKLSPNDVEQRLVMLTTEAENYSALAQNEASIRKLIKHLELLKASNRSPLEILCSISKLGNQYVIARDPEKARACFEEAKQIAKRAEPKASAMRQIALNACYEGNLYRNEANFSAAKRKFLEAINYQWAGDDKQWTAGMYADLADCDKSLGDISGAKAALINAIDNAQKWKPESVNGYKRALDVLSQ